ncbi:hypothetical protein [Clostridium sp.]|uniref:hypothetical protein n=1 Tax=Clostridium sp. TaxID=1506 RepID=UPI003992BF5F
MINLNKIVNDSMKQIENEGFVEKIVKEQLEKTIKDIIDDTFRSWSNFGENLKRHIDENLNVDFNNLNIAGYNTLVLAAIQEKLDYATKVQGVEKLKEAMDKMLGTIKEEYTLSELIEELKGEDLREEYEYCEEDRITLIFDKRYSSTWVSLDTEEEREYSCKYRFAIGEDGKMHSLRYR